MENTSKSSSIEQMEAEKYIFSLVENWLGIPLDANKKLLTVNTYIEPDFYSEEGKIIGEIYAHIGKMKPAHDHKISKDILKMMLYDKRTNCCYRKILVVCDEIVEKQLKGQSILAECIAEFGIEVKRIDLPEEWRSKILSAQSRQRMVNA